MSGDETTILEITKDESKWLAIALCMGRGDFRKNGQISQYKELMQLSRKLVNAEKEAGWVRGSPSAGCGRVSHAKCLRCGEGFSTVTEARDHAIRTHEDPDAGVKKSWLGGCNEFH